MYNSMMIVVYACLKHVIVSQIQKGIVAFENFRKVISKIPVSFLG